ncbi:MAG: carbonic anhydrase [Gemmataceae bacterium]
MAEMADLERSDSGRRRWPSRRDLVCGGIGAAVGGGFGWLLRGPSRGNVLTEATPGTPELALQRLREGNQRFVDGKVRHGHEERSWRQALVSDQHPFAIILGCSDSRVPVELVFDQGFGDLFVTRVAGNVIATDVVGTIGYAVEHLHTRLLVVMGHEGCGAVTAALQAQANPAIERDAPNINALLKLIEPSFRNLAPQLTGAARVSAAVEANVRWSMGQLSQIPAGRRVLETRQVTMVGAVYELATGRVRFLNS